MNTNFKFNSKYLKSKVIIVCNTKNIIFTKLKKCNFMKFKNRYYAEPRSK